MASPRGFEYLAVTQLEILKIRLHRDGAITGGIQRSRAGILGPHQNYIGHILPLVIFEMVVGEVDWLTAEDLRLDD
ncbi:hypothetical protein [Cryobacterium sp. MP_3.1]|uniref:hypothetical protein n=1 Tax=Cryobacterium sp. MP_3.1 TaxID=3071711 RepID=UPI002E1552C8